MSLNSSVIMGRFVRDPELRYTQSGIHVCTFTLAVDRDFADKNTGERQCDFIDVVAWKKTGEIISKYFKRGRNAVIEGRIQTRTWKDKDGKNRKNTELVATHVYFFDSKRNIDSSNTSNEYQYSDDKGTFDEIVDDEFSEDPF